MSSGIYNRFKANLMNKEVDLEADTIKVALLNTSHAFSATNNVFGDVSANELSSGSGYTSGGETLATKTVTQSGTTDWDADNPQWTAATFTANHAVIYDTSVSDNLIASIDFDGDKIVAAGTFTIQFSASGIITLT